MAGSDGLEQDWRMLRWLLLVLLLVVGGLYLAGHVLLGERLPRHTTVAGVRVGGLTPGDARQVLRDQLQDDLRRRVVVVAAGRRAALDPEQVGLDVDVPASVAQVPAGRSWSVPAMWESLVGGQDYPPVVVTIEGLLTDRLTALAADVDRPAVEGRVRFDGGRAEPTFPRAGRVLDVPAAAKSVEAAFPFDGRPVRLPMIPSSPATTAGDVSRAMTGFANPAMSAPVTYLVGNGRIVLRPTDYASALAMVPRHGRVVPRLDKALLWAHLRAPVTRSTFRPSGRPDPAAIAVVRQRVLASFLRLAGDRDGPRVLRLRVRR
ncbi:MAG: hypothetical protein QOK15_277 [Nocardioidaceae bacterium]|jgi:hypothetical protein|nr:hypothetical protein [Nocardioidaceae bacterium]